MSLDTRGVQIANGSKNLDDEQEVVRTRGNASKAVIADFLKSGYTHQNILEVVLGLSQKIISNYVNHLAETPMEEKYSQFSWTKS